MKAIDVVCTMGTRECVDELLLFLRALRVFHPRIPVIVGCTSEMLDPSATVTRPLASSAQLRAVVDSDPHVTWVPCLDAYGPIRRQAMEAQPGVWFPSRHTDFMMEKANLMELAFQNHHRRTTPTPAVAFLDCDVTLLAPLPTFPASAVVGVSPHHIRAQDEALFGKYNGGFVVATDPRVLFEWRKAAQQSRYFDQAALEDVADAYAPHGQLHEFAAQDNYGFWRLFQSPSGSATKEAARFSIAPHTQSGVPPATGPAKALTLLFDGEPLRSIHTHLFLENPEARDVRLFNRLLKRWVFACAFPSSTALLANTAYARAFRSALQS